MIVTGVQAVGSKGVSAVQVAAVDSKDATRAGGASNHAPDAGAQGKAGEPQPVVFPRAGVALDQRPVALRQQQASDRYKSDGNPDRDSEGDGDKS